MMNYLGPNMGASPAAAKLPPAVPGTMPSGIPGAPPASPVLPPAPSISPAVAGAINPGTPGVPPPPDQQIDPSALQYDTLTQDDGTVVLFLKNPDGTRGPAVKIISPPKSAGTATK